MDQAHEDRIRQRAHDIWEREGRPEGRHDEHWQQAVEEIAAEDAVQSPTREAAETIATVAEEMDEATGPEETPPERAARNRPAKARKKDATQA